MKKQTILKTLHYADLFDYPLTADEIKKFLVELADATFEETLSQMGSGPYYCLPGREEIIELRKRRERWSEPKLKKAKRVAGVLKFIPWIKLIGVTGALAMKNSDENDDIDLMIITSSQRLWLTRGLVVTFLSLTGQYRRANKVQDRICPNLMLSKDALEFPNRDLFTAHEIVQMKPIYDRENTYQKFLQANNWVFDFLPNARGKQKSENRSVDRCRKTEGGFLPFPFSVFDPVFRFRSSVFLFLETLAYKMQLKFMESKKTVEVTTPSLIRFHPNDLRQRVLKEYQKRKSLVY